MGKYESLEKDIFGVFGSAEWTAENIKTFPNNFVVTGADTEFLRVSVVPSGQGINLRSLSGVIIIDIFTSAGNGPRRTSLIADKLDQYLVGKSFSLTSGATTQLKNSALSLGKVDSDNSALFRSTYTIPFNFFGV